MESTPTPLSPQSTDQMEASDSPVPGLQPMNRALPWRRSFADAPRSAGAASILSDQGLGAPRSLQGKRIAITGASGTMGQALIQELSRQGARLVALTTNLQASFSPDVEVLPWKTGGESEVRSQLQTVDILILNHGVNVYGDRSPVAVLKAYEVNTFSTWRLAESFLEMVTEAEHKTSKELWINTSEAEVNPAFSPLYELSKRTLGDLITLRRLDAPCVIRKLVLGPFKSQLNPYGVMSAEWVAWAIVALAKRDVRNIIVTINPLTYLAFPIKELLQSLYFRWFTVALPISDDE